MFVLSLISVHIQDLQMLIATGDKKWAIEIMKKLE